MEIQEMDVVMRLRLHGDVYRRDKVADFCFRLTKLNSETFKK